MINPNLVTKEELIREIEMVRHQRDDAQKELGYYKSVCRKYDIISSSELEQFILNNQRTLAGINEQLTEDCREFGRLRSEIIELKKEKADHISALQYVESELAVVREMIERIRDASKDPTYWRQYWEKNPVDLKCSEDTTNSDGWCLLCGIYH